MKALVTGGAGFIGSHLVERLLDRAHDVVVLDNFLCGNKLPPAVQARIRLVEGDVRDAPLVSELADGAAWIFHLAARLGVDEVAKTPIATMETEILGMQCVVRAALARGVEKVVYASTSGIYPSVIEEPLSEESALLSPNSSYSVAKRYNEIYLRSVFQEAGLSSFALRYFNVYGPRQDERMVIPRFFRQALAGRPLHVYGDGTQSRDFTFVHDAVEATVRVAERGVGYEILNVASGREHSIADVARAVLRVTGSPSSIALVDPPPGRTAYEVQRRCGAATKLGLLTDFEVSTSLERGLEQTLRIEQESFSADGR